jgi:hypothetical protein
MLRRRATTRGRKGLTSVSAIYDGILKDAALFSLDFFRFQLSLGRHRTDEGPARIELCV